MCQLLRSFWGSGVTLQGFQLQWMCRGGTVALPCLQPLQSVGARGVLGTAQIGLVPVSEFPVQNSQVEKKICLIQGNRVKRGREVM